MSIGLSIVIPVYNVENYLEKCVTSVLNQKCLQLEIILVDDGSTDNSGNICDKLVHQNKNVSVIHKENGGLSNARNTGLDIAKYDYIYFLDSDDEIKEGLFKTFFSTIEKYDIDVFGFSADVVYSNRVEELKHNITDDQYGIVLSGNNVLKNKVQLSTVPLYIFRRSFLKKNNLRFREGIYYEDMDFTPKVFLRNPKVLYNKDSFYIYNKRNDSITANVNLKKFADMCSISETFLEMLDDEENDLYALNKILITYLLVTEEIYNKLDRVDYKKARAIKSRLYYVLKSKKKYIGFKVRLVSRFLKVFYHIRNIRRNIKEIF